MQNNSDLNLDQVWPSSVPDDHKKMSIIITCWPGGKADQFTAQPVFSPSTRDPTLITIGRRTVSMFRILDRAIPESGHVIRRR
jgi:hypothetical protein